MENQTVVSPVIVESEKVFTTSQSQVTGKPNTDKTPLKSVPSKKVKMTAYFDGLVDLVDHDGKVTFLIKEEDKLEVRDQVERDGVILVPPPHENIPWLLARSDEVIKYYSAGLVDTGFASALYKELVEYHRAISDLPSEEYYGFLACWDMHTYLLEHAQYSPIICFSSLPARGKTRTGKGLVYVAYRGVYEQSLREANIFRYSEHFRGAMFFDIRDFGRRMEHCQSDDLFLGRFERGAKISRVLNPDLGPFKDTRRFNVFGPTIISTNEPIDYIMETRAIPLDMRDAVREFDNDVLPESALQLREKLLAFRALYLDIPLPVVTDKPAASRLGDILRPIQQILLVAHPEGNDEFLRFVARLEDERKLVSCAGFDAQLLMTIIALHDKLVHGAFSVKEVEDKSNEGKIGNERVTTQRIGRRLRTMGFKGVRTESGAAAYMWDDAVIDGLKKRYGLGS